MAAIALSLIPKDTDELSLEVEYLRLLLGVLEAVSEFEEDAIAVSLEYCAKTGLRKSKYRLSMRRTAILCALEA